MAEKPIFEKKKRKKKKFVETGKIAHGQRNTEPFLFPVRN
jgi:hypothetical protein